ALGPIRPAPRTRRTHRAAARPTVRRVAGGFLVVGAGRRGGAALALLTRGAGRGAFARMTRRSSGFGPNSRAASFRREMRHFVGREVKAANATSRSTTRAHEPACHRAQGLPMLTFFPRRAAGAPAANPSIPAAGTARPRLTRDASDKPVFAPAPTPALAL